VLVVLAAGCGGSSLDAETTPLEEGTGISSQRYLADSAGATEAIEDFLVVVRELGASPTEAQLVRAAPSLDAPLQRARAISERLQAATLDDSRLEQQRAQTAEALGEVVRHMQRFTTAAGLGKRRLVALVSRDLSNDLADLQRAAETE
jgi:hypothetical protein